MEISISSELMGQHVYRIAYAAEAAQTSDKKMADPMISHRMP